MNTEGRTFQAEETACAKALKQEPEFKEQPGDSQCRGPGCHPWSGNEIPHAATKILHSQIIYFFKEQPGVQ